LGEEYRLLSSSLCSFLHSLVTLSLLDQIFSSAPYSQMPWPTFLLNCEQPRFVSLISGSLSPWHGVSPSCGWRNGLQYGR
jgi:hypothetical protein